MGDGVIFDTGHMIKNALGQSDFLGHIGGDDFVFISSPKKVDEICRKIIKTFDHEIPNYYDKDSRSRGHIHSKNRNGQVRRFQLMSVSIAVVTNIERTFIHFAEIAEIGAELKKFLKTLAGSNYQINRRRDNNKGLHGRN